MQPVDSVPGLFYIPHAIDSRTASNTMDAINHLEGWKNVGTSGTSRRAHHSGYDYDYVSGHISPTVPIPPEFVVLADKARTFLMSQFDHVPDFNQCLVNEYIGGLGHGISWHTDHKAFGPYIACYTLNSGTEMHFKLDSDIMCVRVEPCSLYIMTGPSRYTWKHSMPLRKTDPNPDGGSRIKRGDRYSITFRSVM